MADGPQGRWRDGYDPFGWRIFKNGPAGCEDFLWDGDVLARSGDIDWFYEPNSFRPMARREAGVLIHIVNDHLGTPKEMFSEGGAWHRRSITTAEGQCGMSGRGASSGAITGLRMSP